MIDWVSVYGIIQLFSIVGLLGSPSIETLKNTKFPGVKFYFRTIGTSLVNIGTGNQRI